MSQTGPPTPSTAGGSPVVVLVVRCCPIPPALRANRDENFMNYKTQAQNVVRI